MGSCVLETDQIECTCYSWALSSLVFRVVSIPKALLPLLVAIENYL
jgi:hypothetical protein